jgi:hypothetical protein
MFATCAFCSGRLDGDGGPSGLGVGRRLAFDEWKGRLWVVCVKCGRWNLTPFDDRLERIETLARLAPQGRLLASTEQVALIRWQAYDLVRVGRPPRAELAGWRYGERLRRRQRERAMIVVPVAAAAVGLTIVLNAAVGGSFAFLVGNATSIGEAIYLGIVGNRRILLAESPVCAACGSVMSLRARDIRRGRLLVDRQTDLALLLDCPRCAREGTMLTGTDAARALRQGLTYLNARRSGRRLAAEAARAVDAAGGPDQLVRQLARRETLIQGIPGERRLALEMAVDEQLEVRELERQWREAEEIAEIADGLLSLPGDLEEQLRRLDLLKRNQPES